MLPKKTKTRYSVQSEAEVAENVLWNQFLTNIRWWFLPLKTKLPELKADMILLFLLYYIFKIMDIFIELMTIDKMLNSFKGLHFEWPLLILIVLGLSIVLFVVDNWDLYVLWQ